MKKKKWFPCSFGKTQKHHILVLLTHLFNEMEKKQSHPPEQPVMYSYFPAVRAVHVRHFGFTEQAQQPCLSVRTPNSNGSAISEQPRKSPWRKPSLKGSYVQLHFQQPFWSLKVSIHILYNQFSSNFLLLQTLFFLYFQLYCSSSLLPHMCLSVPFPNIKQLIGNLW